MTTTYFSVAARRERLHSIVEGKNIQWVFCPLENQEDITTPLQYHDWRIRKYLVVIVESREHRPDCAPIICQDGEVPPGITLTTEQLETLRQQSHTMRRLGANDDIASGGVS